VSIIFDEYLTVGAVDLATHAYWVESLAPLFGVKKVGTDRPIPRTAGARPYARRRGPVQVSLKVQVHGSVDADGAATADSRDGLYDHLRYLEVNLLDDVATTAGTRAAVWHLPDGTTRTADVHVEEFTVTGASPTEAHCLLVLSVPAGRFTDPA
jgi:hypothetical protein